MLPTPKQLLSLVVATALAISQAFGDEEANSTSSEQLALVRSWLPSYYDQLQLVFEYDAGNEKHEQFDSKLLHERIDRIGPTLVIIEAQNAFDQQPRIIGGYNPYKWKNWLGFYERDPGLLIFDLSAERKWERDPQKPRWIKRSPKSYALSFGEGDLILAADLKTGSARNSSFAPSSTSRSVLLGEAGNFLVNSIKIYHLQKTEDSGNAPFAFFSKNNDTAPPPPPPSQRYSVPDYGLPFLELGLALVVIITIRKLYRIG